MAVVLSAFGSLAERVQELEDRAALERWRPPGSAWLAPAEELGPWTAPVVAHLVAASHEGDVLHADCGEGALLDALAAQSVPAIGVEPRGAVAMTALARGCSVTVAEVADELKGRDQAFARRPRPQRDHRPAALLRRDRPPGRGRSGPEAGTPPIVVVVDRTRRPLRPAGMSWHARCWLLGPSIAPTWEFLLESAGFVHVAPLGGPDPASPAPVAPVPVRRLGFRALVSGIHQFVPVLHAGDAVGGHTRRLRDAIAARGIPSRIYVQVTDPRTAAETERVLGLPRHLPARRRAGLPVRHGVGPAAWLVPRPETLVVNYHNVTPAGLFAPWDGNIVAGIQQRARRGTPPDGSPHIARHRCLVVQRSRPGGRGLPRHGRRAPDRDHGPGRARRPAPHSVPTGRGARWLCVGRLVPNKSIEHALMALAVTRAHHDP